MKAFKKTIIHQKIFLMMFGASLMFTGQAFAESDKELQEKALKAREMNHGSSMDHSVHDGVDNSESKFRGVFYGYLPCQELECNGIKMTLSLNAKNRYLLVIQPAKVFNRESFEKGTYNWDNTRGILTLTPYQDTPARKLAIKDEGTLLYVTDETKKGEEDRYLLQRADKAGNREMHIH